MNKMTLVDDNRIIFEQNNLNGATLRGGVFLLTFLLLLYFVLDTSISSRAVSVLVVAALFVILCVIAIFSFKKIIVFSNGKIEVVRLLNKKVLFSVLSNELQLLRYTPPSQTWDPPVIQLRIKKSGLKVFSFSLESEKIEKEILNVFQQYLGVQFKN